MIEQAQAKSARRLRTACDACHNAKMKCSGCRPCASCANAGRECVYSFPNKLGRPKGVKNKKARTEDEDQATSGETTAPPPSIQDPDQTHWNRDGFEFQPPDSGIFTTTAASDTQMSWTFTDPTAGIGDAGGTHPDGNLAVGMVDLGPMDFTSRTPIFSDLETSVFPMDPVTAPLDARDASSNRPTHGGGFSQRLDFDPSALSNQALDYDARTRNGCGCVQRHAKFFCRLKDSDKGDSVSVSATLEAARHILNLFHRSVTCSACHEDEDNAAQVLLVLCIRTVLKQFRTCIRSQSSSSASSRRESRSSSGPLTNESFGGSRGGPRSNAYNVKVDNLELSQDDQAYLVNMLVVRTVKEIKSALRALKTMGDRKDKMQRSAPSDGGLPIDSTAETVVWTPDGDWDSGQEFEKEKLERDDRFLCNAIESLCDGLKELERSLETVCHMPHLS